MPYKTATISTADHELSEELQHLKIPEVTVLTRLTAAVNLDHTIVHIVEFASERAIDLFVLWLATKITKNKPGKTRMNGRKLPRDKDKITRLVQNPESYNEEPEEDPD